MKPVIIFDFGGVIMKTYDYTFRHQWNVKLSLAHGTVERIVHGSLSWKQAQRGEIDSEAYWSDVAQQLNISMKDVAQLKEDFFKGDKLDAEIITLIEQLRHEGYPVGLLSNDSHELRSKLEANNLVRLFDIIVISAEIGVMKPDEKAYVAILEQFKVNPQNAIFIDDMQTNIQGAEQLGIHGIHYTSQVNLSKHIQEQIESIEANAKLD